MFRCEDCNYVGYEAINNITCPKCGGDCMEFNEMTEDQIAQLDHFFDDNLDCFIKPMESFLSEETDDDEKLLWDDFEAAKEVASLDGVTTYTLVSCDNDEMWIIDGWHFVNRVGYFFTSEKIAIPEEGLRYW